jgi:pyruvate dehydrogenase E2 component (dihydrolipoamide acetyltransferase)
MAEFRMPSLGADMDAGRLLEWLVSPGDTVAKGDIVAVVDTSKAAIEVECFTGGVVEQLLVEPGQEVPVGTVLATIGDGAAPEAPAAPAPVAPGAPAAPSPGRAPAPPEPAVGSPLVRRLAHERHVDLASVTGTGPGGRITRHDVEVARPTDVAGAPAPAPATPVPAAPAARARISPMARRLAGELGVDVATVTGTGPGGAIGADDIRRAATEAAGPARAGALPRATARVGLPAGDRAAAMRATIAALMARSKREIPHYYLTETVDLGPAMQWLHERNRELPVSQRIVPAAMLLKAAARAAADVPRLNGFWRDDGFVPGGGVHLGVAISLRGGGLVAPAIHDADRLDLATLMARMRDLAIRTREGRLRGSEFTDPTITVSNAGEQGSESVVGVIYPPQVALVGFGRIVQRPWAVDGLLGVRPVVTVSLAGDHRATDGATGARFLQRTARLLQRPEEL